MGGKSSRPLPRGVSIVANEYPDAEETLNFEVSSIYQDDREENESQQSCFFFARPPPCQRRINLLDEPQIYHDIEYDIKEQRNDMTPSPLGLTETMCLVKQNTKPTASQSVASTVSIESWSFKSLDGTGSITSSKQRRRKLEIYQTDSTMIFNDKDEDWSALLILSNQSRLQLPFRPCKRKQCTCKSNSNGHSNSRRVRKDPQHHRQISDDLQGLWIPLQVDEVQEEDDKELRWLLKAQSERNFCYCATKEDSDMSSIRTHVKDENFNLLDKNVSSRRTRAVSEDLALQQQPPVSPPSPGRRGIWKKSLCRMESIDNGILVAPIVQAKHLSASDSTASQTEETFTKKSLHSSGKVLSDSRIDDAINCERRATSLANSVSDTHAWSVPISNARVDSMQTAKNESQPQFRLRCRSEDVVDMRAGQSLPSLKNGIVQKPVESQNQMPSYRSCPNHRQRARSEDVIDQRSSVSHNIQAECLVEPPLVDKFSSCSSIKHSRSRRGLRTPRNKLSTNSSSLSPTSVMTIQMTQDTLDSKYQSNLQELRDAIDHVRHAKNPMKLIELYQSVAWLHYRNARFDAASCVINHALERFYATQYGSHGCPCLTLEATLCCIEESMKPLLAQLLIAKARIALLANTVDEALLFREAKDLTETALSLIPLTRHLSPDRLLIVAEGLVTLGRIHCQDGYLNLSTALDSFQQSLNIFRFLSQQHCFFSKKYGISMAEALMHVGRLHMDQGFLDLAKDAYWEALRLYRLLHQHESTCLIVDMAMTLTNLGWIHLLESDLALSQRSTMEALMLLQCYYGEGETSMSDMKTCRSLRNLASVEYQLGMIASCGGHVTHALAYWKAALWHQRAAFRVDHPDIAITMEAIGSCYQQLCKWNKSTVFLEGAIFIHKQTESWKNNLDIARIESRLALVMMEKNDAKHAKQYLTRATKRYQRSSAPLDDLGQRAKRWLLDIRMSQRDSQK